MIVEYHLTCASQGTHSVTPVLLEVARQLLPCLDEYLPGEFHGTLANILCVAAWLYCLDLAAIYGKAISASLEVNRYDVGPLLEYFLTPKTSSLTFEEVTQRVLVENWCEVEESLEDLQQHREELKQRSSYSFRLTIGRVIKMPKGPLKGG